MSDSCNVMISVRRTLIEEKVLKWVYGCVTHCLHNCFEGLSKLLIVDLIKKCLYAAKTIRSKNFIRKVFEVSCADKPGKEYVLLLYSKSRW